MVGVTESYRDMSFKSSAIIKGSNYNSELSRNLNDVTALKHVVRQLLIGPKVDGNHLP